MNVGEAERTISAVAGGLLLLYGLSRLSLSTVLVTVAGSALLYRGVTGHCGAYKALDKSTAIEPAQLDGKYRRLRPRQETTDLSLAANRESSPGSNR